MLSAFSNHLEQNFPLLSGKKLLLAVSGGLDSMVMTDLLARTGHQFSIAHCNFQLRGDESDGDADFVKHFAQKHQIPFFGTRFDTAVFASDYRLSVQQAARELRYRWFYELADTEGFDYILTAHHADDKLETFLINLSRGTGIDGLTGIPEQNDRVLRPMLRFSRDSIQEYAQKRQLKWREDSSNASDKYLRNQIRHGLVPQLKAMHPEFLEAFLKTQAFLKQTQGMADDAAVLVFQQVAQKANDEVHFNLAKLKQLPNYKSYLHHWLADYGFTAWNDIYALCESQSGKQVFAPDFRIVKSRHFLILSPLPKVDETKTFSISKDVKEVNFPLRLSICKVNDISDAANNAIFVDAEKLDFPLLLRKWQKGDFFVPFGMGGQSKKVSKYFKDERLSLIEKESAWLLCSGDQIVWIVGKRADERFKVTDSTHQILKITLTPP